MKYIRFFDSLTIDDIPIVGGKNASLGEMTKCLKKEKIPIPQGFAVTAQGFNFFLEENAIKDKIYIGAQERLAAGQDQHGNAEALQVVHHRINLAGR